MKRAIKIAGVLVALLIVAAIALPLLFNADQFRPLLETRLTAVLGRQVTLGGLKLSVFSGSVTASDLAIADDPAFSKDPFLRASSLEAGVELMPLLVSRKLTVTRIAIDQPQIELLQNPRGEWNFSSIGAKSASPAPAAPSSASAASNLSVQTIEVSGGRVTLAKVASNAAPLVVDKVSIEVKDYSADSPFTFSFTAALSGGGEVKLDGKAGPVNAGNAIATPVNASLHVTHLDLSSSGVADPALGIAGIASIDGSVLSTGLSALVSGKLKGEQLKLAKNGVPAKPPLEVDFAVDHDFTNRTGTVKQGDIHLGDSVLSLTGGYNVLGEAAVFDLTLAGSKLEAKELGAFLPTVDVVLPGGASIDQGTAEVNLTARGPLDKLTADGTVGLDGVRLANFDLASKMSVLDELAGIKAAPHTEIQTFRATLEAAPEGTQVRDIDLVVPSIGEITGAGTVSPAHQLAFKMRAAIRSGLGSAAGVGSTGGVPFTVSGTSQSPVFKPDVKALASDKLKDLTGSILGGKKKK